MKILSVIFSIFIFAFQLHAEDHVAILKMNMGIFPGTAEYLKSAIDEGTKNGAKAILIELDTPGGMLQTSQEMVKMMFESPVPIIIYVSPTGSTATSAGVFLTMAAHIAAMAPGTTIGAAHPVTGDGKNIDSDMRAKAENITMAMVRSISEQRGRNGAWAEKAVKESASLTESEALKQDVIDLIAKDQNDLLRSIKGKKIKLAGKEISLEDLSLLPRKTLEMSIRPKVLNTLSDPNVVQLLWLAATTALSIELYNPGAILPGVVGVICLILALASYQIIPVNIGGIALLVVGVLLIGAEMFITSGVLAVGGIIAIVLGSIYLIDVAQVPGINVSMPLILSTALSLGALLSYIAFAVVRSQKKKVTSGQEGLIGLIGTAVENVSNTGRVFVNGEYWSAECSRGIIEKDAEIRVLSIKPGMILEVEKI
ncbi:MAG: nodulation protein NfeD [bacterium]|nr:nodulation protein NfeD [bacterium]